MGHSSLTAHRDRPQGKLEEYLSRIIYLVSSVSRSARAYDLTDNKKRGLKMLSKAAETVGKNIKYEMEKTFFGFTDEKNSPPWQHQITFKTIMVFTSDESGEF